MMVTMSPLHLVVINLNRYNCPVAICIICHIIHFVYVFKHSSNHLYFMYSYPFMNDVSHSFSRASMNYHPLTFTSTMINFVLRLDILLVYGFFVGAEEHIAEA